RKGPGTPIAAQLAFQVRRRSCRYPSTKNLPASFPMEMSCEHPGRIAQGRKSLGKFHPSRANLFRIQRTRICLPTPPTRNNPKRVNLFLPNSEANEERQSQRGRFGAPLSKAVKLTGSDFHVIPYFSQNYSVYLWQTRRDSL